MDTQTDNLNWLLHTPPSDANFKAALENADLETLNEAHREAALQNHKTRFRAINAEIRRRYDESGADKNDIPSMGNYQADAARKQIAKQSPAPAMIPLEKILDDHSLQIRVENDTDQIDNLVEAMEQGADIPPIDLYAKDEFADPSYLIGDGWHRYYAAKASKRKEILAIIHPGGRPAALKHALGANASHGLRRSNKDKRHAVEVALAEFPKLSNRAIADICKISHQLVNKLRSQVATVATSRIGQDGKEYPAGAAKGVQMTLFDRLNEQFKPVADRIDIVCKAGWWIDATIPQAEKLEAATSLEDRLKNDLQRVQDLKKNLLKNEQTS